MDANRYIEEGLQLAREGNLADALKVFEEDICFTQSPLAMSYYAVSLASVEKNFDKALSLCLMAAEKEFYNPEIYLNLGRIFLLNGQKSVAYKAFRKGLRFDSGNTAIRDELKKMGMRRRPVISFLPRNSAINKFLGKLATRSFRKALSANI